MRTIHKHQLKPGGTKVSTFERLKFLHVAAQHNEPCVWVEVNTLEREQVVNYLTVPTGGTPPACGRYLGTAQLDGGSLVFHVYVEPGPVTA